MCSAVAEFGHMLSQTRFMETIWRGLALHVDGCPIKARVWHGRPYANVIYDCVHW